MSIPPIPVTKWPGSSGEARIDSSVMTAVIAFTLSTNGLSLPCKSIMLCPPNRVSRTHSKAVNSCGALGECPFASRRTRSGRAGLPVQAEAMAPDLVALLDQAALLGDLLGAVVVDEARGVPLVRDLVELPAAGRRADALGS